MYKYSRKSCIYSRKLYLCVNIILTYFEFSTLLSNFVEQTYKSPKADKTAPFSQSYRHSQQSYQQAIAENNNSQRKTPGISRCTFIRFARAEIGFPTFFSQKPYFYAFVKETSRSMRKSVFFSRCLHGLPILAVKAAKLDCLCDMSFTDGIARIHIGNGFGKTQNAVVTARGQTQTVKGCRKNRVRLLSPAPRVCGSRSTIRAVYCRAGFRR